MLDNFRRSALFRGILETALLLALFFTAGVLSTACGVILSSRVNLPGLKPDTKKKPPAVAGKKAAAGSAKNSAAVLNAVDFRVVAKEPFRIRWLRTGVEEIVTESKLKDLMRENTYEVNSSLGDIFVKKESGNPFHVKNSAAVLNASVDHQKIKTAEIDIPVIAADVLTYEGGELGKEYPEKTRLYYHPDALRDPEYLQTVKRSPLQIMTHEKNTGEGNRDVDGWPTDVWYDETEQRVKVHGVVHGENNVAYVSGNKNKPSFGTSAFISFLQVDRTPGTTPDGKPYDAVVRKAVNNHVAILPNVRDTNNVILAMNALDPVVNDRIGDYGRQRGLSEKDVAYLRTAKRAWENRDAAFRKGGAQERYAAMLDEIFPEMSRDKKPAWIGNADADENGNTKNERNIKNAEEKKMDYDEFKGHMNAWQAEEKEKADAVEKIKNDAVAAALKNTEDREKEKKAANAAEEEAKKKEEEEAANAAKASASNALPSEEMVKDFTQALGIRYEKTPTLAQLAADAGVTAENPAGLIQALNAKRAELRTMETAAAKNSAGTASTVDELLRTI